MPRFMLTLAVEESGEPALEITEYDDAAALMAHVRATCLDADAPGDIPETVAQVEAWASSPNPTGSMVGHHWQTGHAIALVTVIAPAAPPAPPAPPFVLPEPTPRGEDTLASFLWDIAVTAFESNAGGWFRIRRARADGVIEPWSDDDDAEDGDPAAPALLPWYHEDGRRTEGWAATVYFLPDGEEDPEYPARIVTADTLRRGFDHLVTETPERLGLNRRYISALLAGYFTLDAGSEIDAEVADYLLQIAMFGKVICS